MSEHSDSPIQLLNLKITKESNELLDGMQKIQGRLASLDAVLDGCLVKDAWDVNLHYKDASNPNDMSVIFLVLMNSSKVLEGDVQRIIRTLGDAFGKPSLQTNSVYLFDWDDSWRIALHTWTHQSG